MLILAIEIKYFLLNGWYQFILLCQDFHLVHLKIYYDFFCYLQILLLNFLLGFLPLHSNAILDTVLTYTLICFLQMNYEDFCHIASVCTEQIGPKCRRFFSPSNFMKFEKDEQGRIAILPFYLYVMRTVSHFQLVLF
jgi:hypothetical protein